MKTELGTCQVRSETCSPCTRPAALKLLGVPFCEQCAREQRAYFAIGELAQARGPRAGWTRQVRSLHDKSLIEMLDRRQREARRLAEARERRENSLEGAVARSCNL